VSYSAVTSQPAETDLQKWQNAGTWDARAVSCWQGHADRYVVLAGWRTSMTGCASRARQRTKAGSKIVKAGPRFPLAPPRPRPRLHESAAGFVPAQVPHRQYYSCQTNEKVTGVEPDFEKTDRVQREVRNPTGDRLSKRQALPHNEGGRSSTACRQGVGAT
jgi:hypothetical protein